MNSPSRKGPQCELHLLPAKALMAGVVLGSRSGGPTES